MRGGGRAGHLLHRLAVAPAQRLVGLDDAAVLHRHDRHRHWRGVEEALEAVPPGLDLAQRGLARAATVHAVQRERQVRAEFLEPRHQLVIEEVGQSRAQHQRAGDLARAADRDPGDRPDALGDGLLAPAAGLRVQHVVVADGAAAVAQHARGVGALDLRQVQVQRIRHVAQHLRRRAGEGHAVRQFAVAQVDGGQGGVTGIDADLAGLVEERALIVDAQHQAIRTRHREQHAAHAFGLGQRRTVRTALTREPPQQARDAGRHQQDEE